MDLLPLDNISATTLRTSVDIPCHDSKMKLNQDWIHATLISCKILPVHTLCMAIARQYSAPIKFVQEEHWPTS